MDQKKFRQKYNLFLVEGNKTIREIPHSPFRILDIYSINPGLLTAENTEVTQISERDLKKISFLQHPKDSIAVCEIKAPEFLTNVPVQLILDGIQDPGNLGTIIRLADWFGIKQIVCSPDTVDVYNPKVIQASMGSFLRVNVAYENIDTYLLQSDSAVLGTDMEGENLFTYQFPEKFNLVLGNEGNGIQPEVEQLLTEKISIPRFGESQATESLNVSMAAGIILGQIFGQK